MGHDVEDQIATVARRQHGVVTRAQLLGLGLRAGAVRRRTTSGRLHRLHRGVYLVGPIMPARAREMAAALACGPGGVVSHLSAASLWGLIAPRDDGAPVDVSVVRGRAGDRHGIRARRVSGLQEEEERTELDGIPVTTPARTVIDLASVVGVGELERAVARAEREHLVDRSGLSALVARSWGRPGVPLLRAVLTRGGGPAFTRSEAEATFLDLVRKARLPAPETNVVVVGCEVDFLWRAEGIAVEVDGYRYHSARSRFENDRRRAAHLAAHGIQVIPVTWRQIADEGTATAVQLGRALLRAGRP